MTRPSSRRWTETTRSPRIVLGQGIEHVKLLGLAGVKQSDGEAGELLTSSSEFDLAIDVTRTSFLAAAYIGFLDPTFSGVALDSLRVIVAAEDVTLLDASFDDELLMAAFLDDNVLALGDLMAEDGLLNLRISLQFTAGEGSRVVRTDFVVGGVAPEPSTGTLLALGLLLLGSRRRGGRRAC